MTLLQMFLNIFPPAKREVTAPARPIPAAVKPTPTEPKRYDSLYALLNDFRYQIVSNRIPYNNDSHYKLALDYINSGIDLTSEGSLGSTNEKSLDLIMGRRDRYDLFTKDQKFDLIERCLKAAQEAPQLKPSALFSENTKNNMIDNGYANLIKPFAECGMAFGPNDWVRAASPLNNPKAGKEMLLALAPDFANPKDIVNQYGKHAGEIAVRRGNDDSFKLLYEKNWLPDDVSLYEYQLARSNDGVLENRLALVDFFEQLGLMSDRKSATADATSTRLAFREGSIKVGIHLARNNHHINGGDLIWAIKRCRSTEDAKDAAEVAEILSERKILSLKTIHTARFEMECRFRYPERDAKPLLDCLNKMESTLSAEEKEKPKKRTNRHRRAPSDSGPSQR